MKNKKLLLLLLILFIAIVIITIFITRNNITKIKKGYEIFGNDYCKGHPHGPAGAAFTTWTCEICGYKEELNNTATPILCSDCAKATGRCSKCGKLKHK